MELNEINQSAATGSMNSPLIQRTAVIETVGGMNLPPNTTKSNQISDEFDGDETDTESYLKELKIFSVEWAVGSSMILLALGAIWIVLINVINHSDDGLSLGIAPFSWTDSHTSQAFTIQTSVIIVPITSIIVLLGPWLLSLTKKTRLQLHLYFLLRQTLTKGAAAKDILQATLRLSRISFLSFTFNNPKKPNRKAFYGGYGEFFTWLVTQAIFTTAITSILVVDDGLSTVSIESAYESFGTTDLANLMANTTCLQGDWPQRALDSVATTNSKLIYALRPITYSATTKDQQLKPNANFVITGYGTGLTFWSNNTNAKTDAWKSYDSSWFVGCLPSSTECVAYSTAAPASAQLSSQNRTYINQIFTSLALIDPDLIALASSGSKAQDAFVNSKALTQAVPYLVLIGVDNSTLSFNYKAAYLISRACSVSSKPLTISSNNGLNLLFSIHTIATKPVIVMNPAKLIWYTAGAPTVFILVVTFCAAAAIVPYILLAYSWLSSPIGIWWPVVHSCSDFGPYLLYQRLQEFVPDGGNDVVTGMEGDGLLFLLVNHVGKVKLGPREDGWMLATEVQAKMRFGSVVATK